MTRVLAGRAAIVTGASEGLGRAIARAYVREGADVLICARGEDQLEGARAEIASEAGPGQRVLALKADVSQEDDVARLVAHAVATFERVPILVNNAGVYGPLGPIEDVDWRAWKQAVEINLFGSVMAARALVPHLKALGYGKILQVSGGGATNPLPRITAYAAAKAAVVRFAESLALELRPFGIDVNAIAPGALNTGMMTELLDAGPGAVGEGFYDRMTKVAAEGGTPLEVGADLAVFLASADSDGITGRLISAPWDDWRALPGRRRDLEGTDIFTLRRILPADRGRDWEKT